VREVQAERIEMDIEIVQVERTEIVIEIGRG
jgi:hypothetical protein